MAQPPTAPQSLPVPQHVYQTQAQLAAALEKVEGKPVDLLKASWDEVEKGVIKLLGGPFQPHLPEHQALALGIAGAFAMRMHVEHQAFWFPNRDSPEGASLGFPDAIIMLSPFDKVMNFMIQGKLALLDSLAANIRGSLAQVRFNPTAAISLGGGQPKLGPADYQRLFDPGFLQFVVLDPAKAKKTAEEKPEVLAREIRDALGRTQPPLPPEVRQQFEGQIVMPLQQQLEPGKSMADQVERAPQLVELMVHLAATAEFTGCVPEEFWALVLQLLFIGVPQQFPRLDEKELEDYRKGVEPLEIFVDVLPHVYQAAEEGLMGIFPLKDNGFAHPSFSKVGMTRLIQLNPESVVEPLKQFDPDKTLDAVNRFRQYLAEKAGKPAEESPQVKEMLQVAMRMLADLKRLVTTVQGQLCVRRLTAAEMSSEQVLALVRRAMQSGRIILTS